MSEYERGNVSKRLVVCVIIYYEAFKCCSCRFIHSQVMESISTKYDESEDKHRLSRGHSLSIRKRKQYEGRLKKNDHR